MSSWWDKVYEGAAGAGDRILGAYTEIEKAKVSSFQSAHAEQVAARYTPQVDYQNRGEPVTVAQPKPQRQLVGDKDDGDTENKKLMYVGGGIGVLLLLIGVAVIARN